MYWHIMIWYTALAADIGQPPKDTKRQLLNKFLRNFIGAKSDKQEVPNLAELLVFYFSDEVVLSYSFTYDK
ncbi:hypothetical protein EV213_1086 [Aureibacillus halotolerans]|uniref:Uncharacterized protein n=1 Tax=Aureibacillus halotolerans TaxID=1508390 RepID=A0A4R6TYN6_9BACI|nr:hypothetical protein EV213_1086 [Aureibacillus halotolerans]